MWGQITETDYSGTYYIGAVTHNSDTPADNFYLCPTENWRYYDSENATYTSTRNGQPFLTTYQCRGTVGYDENNALWIIEKHPTLNYYYIKHAADGKYITYNKPIFNNAGRVRLHLEESPANDNYALFAINYNKNSKVYQISSKEASEDNKTNGGRIYMNVNKGNKPSLAGDGDAFSNVQTGGIIGLWTSGYNEASGSGKFYLEPKTPTITHNNNGTFTITAAEGATIYYTTNGDTPTTSTETSGTTSVTFDQTESMSVIKAIAVVGDNVSSVRSVTLYTYTYYIVNVAGDIAVKKEVVQAEGKSLSTIDDIPADIRSSYLAGESASFYSFSEAYTSKDQLTDEVGISVTPSNNANIYVTYTTDHLSEKFLKLRGARAFNIRNLSGENAYDNSGTLAYEAGNNTQASHMWNIGGSKDPYDVEIKNIGTGNYLVFSTPPTLDIAATATTKFILMAGSANGDGSTYEQVNLMPVTGTGDNDFSKSKAEIRAYAVSLSFTYKLIDRQNKLLATIASNESELKLPDEWISPLVSTYHFYKTASVNGDIYTLSEPVTSPFDVGSGQPIYVNYDVSDAIDIEGGKTYMLRYLNGQNFKQEKGDKILSDETKAVYPYNNGDFNLYVYGKEQWDAQVGEGASTRSRWLWYIESNHNDEKLDHADPYHVVVKSYQDQSIKYDGTNYAGTAYLRTYKPSDYSSIVTGTTYKNTGGYKNQLPENERDGCLPTDKPTEYMLIGTSLSNVKLVTLNAIDDGTTNERRIVNSFEQYWKNNPTINGDESKDIPAVLTNKVTQEGRNIVLTAEQKAEVASQGSNWHVYKVWAYSAPWVNNGDEGKTKTKQYREEEHCLQTISMGTGEFVFEEVSLKPQVILLDNHGWEIMRTPLDQPEKLKEYNSPMVEQYQWYPKAAKVSGYHKFIVSDQEIIVYDAAAKATANHYTHNSTSLADIPYNHFTENGWDEQPEKVKTDFYVTYTVKSPYANAYTGAARAADTKASTYLLKQGSKYAKTSGMVLEKADAPASIQTADDNMQWYLKPNFDIDREMGYRYIGEEGAQDDAKTKYATEQEYVEAGKNGFDPYNVQIQSKYNPKRYFTANTSAISLSSGVWTGTSTQISLQNLNVKQHASGYDQTTLNITNATFMVVSDANGNMRLMPRFDNSKVANSDVESNPFTTLAEQHAAAEENDKGTDTQTLWLEHVPTPTEIHKSSEITEMNGYYLLAEDFQFDSFTSLGTSSAPFTGTIDGQYNTFASPNTPLVAYADGATIRNLILDNVSISGGTNVGAICNEATGATRIYNCGILATGSTANTDEDGYTYLTNCSSSVSGSGYVGSIVGLLDGESRVINCFSYANVSGGTEAGGIVGHNNVATTATNIKTMVMNCMYYGEVSGTSIAPIYNGEIITNVGDGENIGVSNFNYFRLESAYIQDTEKAKVYNCALGAETRFLQRFEFFRHLQNSHRELAAWWATGNYANKDEMAKWILLPSQIGSSTPYPVLARPGYYPSVVNIDAENAPLYTERNKGGNMGTLSVTIQMGDGGAVFGPPTGAEIIYPSLTLNITDKDPDHFNFNYYKVQLPYYNEVGTKNYTGNRVVTGWKIVSITGGTAGNFTTGDDATTDTNGKITSTPYNFADRNCTNKDLYSESGRVFNQGAYWDVPEGVSAIIIEPYWAKAAYVADENADMVYNTDMKEIYIVPDVGGGHRYTDNTNYNIAGGSQKVFTTIKSAVENADGLNKPTSNSVNDYAVVLVGNVHQYTGDKDPIGDSYKYTVTSIDLDGDNEPDYSLMLRDDGRNEVHPLKWDFINIPGLGMAQKSTGGTGSYNLGILCPKGWFEATNTALFRVTQMEYEFKNKVDPLIVQGGVMEQWVSSNQKGTSNKIPYYHVGGNVWFKEFHLGCHQDKTGNNFVVTKHSPVSVTGGDFNEFYLTGLYLANTSVDNYADNAECYINGGRFGTVAGAAMEGIGKTDGADETGNITWQIQNADIKEFYGGGINAAKPVTGNISTTITGGKIDLFCGGPKFGDMSTDKTVVTNATGCEFGTFFGAGYGGSSYSRRAPRNITNMINMPAKTGDNKTYGSWNAWVKAEYKQASSGTDFPGISTQFSYQFIPNSGNADNVGRLFVEHVLFSLAKTRGVTSTLNGCTITGSFYGGGSLGMVDGPATSTLTNCTVNGNVFGGGYSASIPTIEVDSIGFRVEPYYYTDLGTYRTGVRGQTTTYKWAHGDEISIDKDNKILYTTENLNSLGAVTGNVTLTINGTTTVGECVYGGGEESNVGGNTEVNITSGNVRGSVYGGGKIGSVGTFTPATQQNVDEDDAEKKYTYDYYKFVVGEPYTCATNTGLCKVNVTGGIIGPDKTMNMKAEGGPDDAGHVFGAGRGTVDPYYNTTMTESEKLSAIADLCNDDGTAKAELQTLIDNLRKLAYVDSTEVTINGTAFVKGSVYGGSENGHVLNGTHVMIKGGQIGCGMQSTTMYPETVFGTEYVATDNVNLECTHWDYVAPHTPYDKFANGEGKYPEGSKPQYVFSEPENALSADKARNQGTDGHTFYGNVFGGGSGYYPYAPGRWNPSAGSVRGNTKVEISGGHILTSAYGGNEMTDVHGKATVKMTGGTIGVPRTVKQIVDHPLTSYLFGGGKGDQRIFFNKNTNVNEVEMEITGGTIYGSVFGGGEDGHVLRDVKLTIGNENGTGPKIGTTGTSYVDGNVFGGGRGFSGEALTAGNVGGSIELNIKSGTILGSVYGGGRLASVGYGLYLVDEEKTIGGQTIKPYGTMRPDNQDDNGETIVGFKRGHITINISGGTIGNDLEYEYNPTANYKTSTIPNTKFDANNRLLYTTGGNVFAGGMGRLYYLDGTTLLTLWPKLGKCKTTTLNMTGGYVKSNVYGGSEIGVVAETTTVNVKGGIIGTRVSDLQNDENYYFYGSIFGGGKGSRDDITAKYPEGTKEEDKVLISEAGTIGGNVTVHLNEGITTTKGALVDKVFGCNDMNGTPRGHVLVHIHATQSEHTDKVNVKEDGIYDVTSVFGGGNNADYIPNSTDEKKSTEVIIEGCDLTSIEEVYGGGYGAATPATSVLVKGTHLINNVFGGGYGAGEGNPGANIGFYTNSSNKNDYAGATGKAVVQLMAGHINNVFGGSNTKGDIKGGSSIKNLTKGEGDVGPACCDALDVGNIYGGGKDAPMYGGAEIVLGCMPNDWIEEIYAGAENADVGNDVSLTLTSGKFGRVFGGNKSGGRLHGGINVNIEENGTCGTPIIIGELYGGGNEAPYSIYGYKNEKDANGKWIPREKADYDAMTDEEKAAEGMESGHHENPQVNVRAFTSIGNIYGGGLGETAVMVGSPTVNINEVEFDKTIDNYRSNAYDPDVEDATRPNWIGDGADKVKLYPHTDGKMGVIGNVFGGGNAAKVIGNTKVNIGTTTKETFVSLTDNAETTDVDEREKTVVGADIRGNVYGGGNNAEVTGNTNVVIGKKNE